jgi:hypothetical protein
MDLSGTARTTNSPARTLKGVTVTPQATDVKFEQVLGTTMPPSLTVEFYYDDGSGIRLLATQDEADQQPSILAYQSYVLKYPVASGTRWNDGGETSSLSPGTLVNFVETVETMSDQVIVPAGSYSGCVRVHAEGTARPKDSAYPITAESTEWFAPEVGLVKNIQTEKSPNESFTYLRQLESVRKTK